MLVNATSIMRYLRGECSLDKTRAKVLHETGAKGEEESLAPVAIDDHFPRGWKDAFRFSVQNSEESP